MFLKSIKMLSLCRIATNAHETHTNKHSHIPETPPSPPTPTCTSTTLSNNTALVSNILD